MYWRKWQHTSKAKMLSCVKCLCGEKKEIYPLHEMRSMKIQIRFTPSQSLCTSEPRAVQNLLISFIVLQMGKL